jgi:hypothetical protein
VVTDVNFSSGPNELPTEFFIKVNRELKHSFPNLKIAVYPRLGGYTIMVVSESNYEELDNMLIERISDRTQKILESISLDKETGSVKSLGE